MKELPLPRWLTSVVEIAGAGLASYGVALVSLPAALIVGGAFLVVVAVRNG